MAAFIENGDGTVTFADGELAGKTYRRVPEDQYRVINDIPYELVSDEDTVTYYSRRDMVAVRRSMYQEFMAYISCLKAEECIMPKTAEQLSNMMNRFYEFTKEPN